MNNNNLHSQSSNRKRKQFATVTKYLVKYKRYLILGGMAIILANSIVLVMPYVTKLIFDALESGQPLSLIIEYIIFAFIVAVFSGVFRFAMRRTIIWMSRHIEFDLRGEIFAHLLKLSPSFYHKHRTGDLMAKMTNDLEAVRQMIGPGIMYISDTIIKLAISFGVMLYLSPKLTFYAVIPLIILPLAVNKIGNLIHKYSMKIQQKFSELTAAAQENLAGIRVIRAYQQEPAEIEHYNELSKKYIVLNMTLAKLQGLFIPSMRLIASLSYLVVFYFGGLAIIKGELRLGDIVAFFGYLSMILWPMIAIGWVTSLYQRGKASLERINDILFTEPDIKDNGDRAYSQSMQGKIEFRNLKFKYDGDYILDGINLTIKPGQSIGLVGMTGSGKTTLVSLLTRLFTVKRGQLFIDDIDINDWKLSSLRKQIGFATQESFLFSNTIRENILFGRDNSDNMNVNTASEIAALSKDIESFPNSYETIVGERGITLSGGQKQRTAIARAIITHPPVIIFDDATSSVDTETEEQINKNIRQNLNTRTLIIISHRVSSVKDADLILYLHEGKIVEQGTHSQLLELDRNYAQLHRSQLLEMELERL